MQRQAVRCIQKDLISREPGFVTRMLDEPNLPKAPNPKKKIKENCVPYLPTGHFLNPASKSRRQIKPRTIGDFIDLNIFDRLIIKM